jgi:DNA invertase Pin-like site-specific DNA recombinase
MRRRVTRAERAEVIRLYESGLATRAVAERLEVSKGCVLKILKAEGVTMRPRGNPGHSRQ